MSDACCPMGRLPARRARRPRARRATACTDPADAAQPPPALLQALARAAKSDRIAPRRRCRRWPTARARGEARAVAPPARVAQGGARMNARRRRRHPRARRVCARCARPTSTAVMAIEQRAYAFPWTQGVFRDCLLANHPAWVLVEADGTILGYAVLSVAADEAHVLNVCTAPEVQGRGHGRRLLRALLQLARGAARSACSSKCVRRTRRRSRCTTTKASTRSAAARAITPRKRRPRGCAGDGAGVVVRRA